MDEQRNIENELRLAIRSAQETHVGAAHIGIKKFDDLTPEEAEAILAHIRSMHRLADMLDHRDMTLYLGLRGNPVIVTLVHEATAILASEIFMMRLHAFISQGCERPARTMLLDAYPNEIIRGLKAITAIN